MFGSTPSFGRMGQSALQPSVVDVGEWGEKKTDHVLFSRFEIGNSNPKMEIESLFDFPICVS